MGDPTESSSLRAELMASAVVSAHNHVLRRWLRGESVDPVAEVDEAMREVLVLFASRIPSEVDARGATVVAFRTGRDLDSLLPDLRRLIEGGAER
jgi:hypothetical protein